MALATLSGIEACLFRLASVVLGRIAARCPVSTVEKHISPLELGQPLEVICKVDHPDLIARASYPEGADEKSEAVLLARGNVSTLERTAERFALALARRSGNRRRGMRF